MCVRRRYGIVPGRRIEITVVYLAAAEIWCGGLRVAAPSSSSCQRFHTDVPLVSMMTTSAGGSNGMAHHTS
jgi:hypothetical protein